MIEWENCQPPIDRSAITEVEQAWGIRFPEDYVKCVLENHGGNPRPNGVRVGQGSAVFNSLLNFNPPHPWRATTPDRMVDYYSNLIAQNLLPNDVYPFAFDPAGNYFAFDYRNSASAPSIVFLEHELETEEGYLYDVPVAESFTEMLDNMFDFEDEEYYVT